MKSPVAEGKRGTGVVHPLKLPTTDIWCPPRALGHRNVVRTVSGWFGWSTW